MTTFTYSKRQLMALFKQIADKHSDKTFDKDDLMKLVVNEELKSLLPKKNRGTYSYFCEDARLNKRTGVRGLWIKAKEDDEISRFTEMAQKDKGRYKSEIKPFHDAAIIIQTFYQKNTSKIQGW